MSPSERRIVDCARRGLIGSYCSFACKINSARLFSFQTLVIIIIIIIIIIILILRVVLPVLRNCLDMHYSVSTKVRVKQCILNVSWNSGVTVKDRSRREDQRMRTFFSQPSLSLRRKALNIACNASWQKMTVQSLSDLDVRPMNFSIDGEVVECVESFPYLVILGIVLLNSGNFEAGSAFGSFKTNIR